MNSLCCLNIILKNIHHCSNVIEKGNELDKLTDAIFKLGDLTLQKSLSCSLLKNILLALKQLYSNSIINDRDYHRFLKNVNSFYKSQNLCIQYKLTIIPCFSPAVETEILQLLKLCSTISNVEELVIVKSAARNSVLVQACLCSKETVLKVIKLLRKAFIQSEGNPVIGYLTFHLFDMIELSSYPNFLHKEMYTFKTFSQFPFHLLPYQEQELYIKQFKDTCIEDINRKFYNEMDVVFCFAAFPMFYYNLLNVCFKDKTNSVSDFLRFLCIFEKFKSSDWISNLSSAKDCDLWKFLIN